MARRSLPSSRTRSRTPPCQSRTARSTRGRRSREARVDVAGRLLEQVVRRPASDRQASAARSAADSACSTISVSSPDSTATVSFWAGCGRPRAALRSAVADPADLVLETPHQLAGADELLPPRASTSPRSRVPSWVAVVEGGEPVGVRLVDGRCAAARRSAPASRAPCEIARVRCPMECTAPSRVLRTTTARASRRRPVESSQRPDRRDRRAAAAGPRRRPRTPGR